MPKLRTETFGGGDQSWLGSAHGIGNCRTETIDISAFTASTHYPNGYIRRAPRSRRSADSSSPTT